VFGPPLVAVHAFRKRIQGLAPEAVGLIQHHPLRLRKIEAGCCLIVACGTVCHCGSFPRRAALFRRAAFAIDSGGRPLRY
jgi:hypothetical protein